VTGPILDVLGGLLRLGITAKGVSEVGKGADSDSGSEEKEE